jgi:hypothetical protein
MSPLPLRSESINHRSTRWQGKLERKQGFLGRIVDIGAELLRCRRCAFALARSGRTGPGA